jgi:hypothetical protein
MNAVEIEEAVSNLAAQPFKDVEFPFAFLEAFGFKDTTVRRLRSGASNASDVPGGVLQRNNIHIAVAPTGAVGDTLAALRASPKTASAKTKFILATDGAALEAEDLLSGETIACDFADLAQHFGFFLPLAGISTVKEIKNNPVDVKATGRLNKLYVELLKDNPDWGTEGRRHELNQFMARLIFCFFAEDTGIFEPQQFTDTVRQLSDSQSENTHDVLGELFRAMDMKGEERAAKKVRGWADKFPYVNGGLFTGTTDCPRFSRIARSYLLRAGELNWKEINPDIFGSMIQAVADDDERGELGMHYTSVPNILKVLNPLFLDDLREQLEAAGNNARKLRNLRKRLSTIRVFDPACGSGNFLVIAYREMRAIEAEIVRRLGDEVKRSVISLSNFYGIEIKGFAAEIARLALLIAEFQSDCLHLSQHEARSMMLPLHKTGQIHIGNALRIDWLKVCPIETVAAASATDLGGGEPARSGLPRDLLRDEAEFEIYICGNPPYLGGKKQSDVQKDDMISVFGRDGRYKNLDYICAFFVLAVRYVGPRRRVAFVSTSSINQGTHVPTFWPIIFDSGAEIVFGYEPFRWSNNAARNAGVFVTIIGLGSPETATKYIFGEHSKKTAAYINAYLIDGGRRIVEPSSKPLSGQSPMITGNAAYDGGFLFFEPDERDRVVASFPNTIGWFVRVSGTSEFTDGKLRWCLWLEDESRDEAEAIPVIGERISGVLDYRRNGGEVAVTLVDRPHQFRYRHRPRVCQLLVPQVSAEKREYLPIGLLGNDVVLTHLAHVVYDPQPYDLALLSSKLHNVWVRALGGRLGNGIRYSSNLCWNTFPLPRLTRQNRADLSRSSVEILLAREVHFPATIAELYDPHSMPDNLRLAHEANDEVLERIYIGRRFRNDTERLEKLFELYTRMTADRADTNKLRKTNARTA